MYDLQFTTELDEQNRIRVPENVARKIPPHASIGVRLQVESRVSRGRSTGALRYYMEHGIEMPGILPFDRNSLYSRPE